jgi:hypothetical protein
MRYSTTRLILTAVVAVLSASCDRDILDIEPQDRIAESAVWKDEALTRAYHTEMYNVVQHGFGIHMASKYTDEAFNNAPCCGANLFKLNTLTPDNVGDLRAPGDFWQRTTSCTSGKKATRTFERSTCSSRRPSQVRSLSAVSTGWSPRRSS